MSRRSAEPNGTRRGSGLLGLVKRNPKVLLPVAVLILGMAMAGGLVVARPSVSTQQVPKVTPLVQVLRVEPESTRLSIRSQGTVSPRTESDLIAEVSGRVNWVSSSLAAGGFVSAGESLIRIDARDYEVAVTRSKAALARAESQLALAKRASERLRELASRGVASPVALDDAENAELVAEANRLEAEAAQTQARNDLERTSITAPFEGRVRVKHVDLGQFVNRGAPLARIYAVDYAEVRLPIPDDAAAHVELPIAAGKAGGEQVQPEVTLTAEFGGRPHRWTGRIVRTEGELDPRTRMIHAVARIENPYSPTEPSEADGPSGRPPLAVGLFVEAEIHGRQIDGVYSLPHSALRDSDRVVVIDAEDRAHHRRVELLQRLQDRVLIASGLAPGERVVTTPLALTVDGMRVQVEEPVDGEPFPVNAAIAWFARNHVAANLMMFLLILGGVTALPSIKREIFPEISIEVISVSVEYPGASPAEVEQAICIRIEEELQGLQGVKRIRSTASESSGSVMVELMAGEDVRRRMDEIRSRVDRIESFPENAKPAQVTQAALRIPVLDVAVAGNVEESELKILGERVRDELTSLAEISDAELVATRDYEIAIELSERDMQRHGLSFDDVVHAVRRSSIDLPGGVIRTDAGEILLRTKGQAYRGRDFERLPLISRSDGTRLTLGEVAHVVDGFEDGELISRFDDRPAVLVQIYRVGQQSALKIAAVVADYVERTDHTLPKGVTLTVTQNDARFLRDRLDTLLGAGKTGFALVLLSLALFLRLRLAFWVSLGIPLSFLGAIALMPSLDLSINLISLMAFIVVLGIVVDDAIVVGENAHTEQVRTGDSLLGAIRGAQGIAVPVVFGVLTTVAAFAPMLWVPGPMGMMVRVIPMIVVVCLLFSLFESLFVLPAHLALGSPTDREARNPVSAAWRRLQNHVAAGLRRFIDEHYGPLLDRAIEWRYLTTAIGIFALLVTSGLLAGGWIRFHFQPEVEGEATVAYLTMPQGTPHEVTAEGIRQLADAARRVEAELGEEIFSHMHTTVGQQPYKLKQAEGPASFAAAFRRGGNLGEVQIEAVPDDRRDLSVAEITRRWRAEAGQVLGAEELTYSSSIMTAGSPVLIELSGPDLAELRAAAAMLKTQLGQFPGVLDIRDSFRGGKQELELTILPSAEALGLTARDLGRQVRQAFYGEEAQRVQRGRDDVPVVVRYPATERRSLADLENMRIRTADGSAVPFSSVARVSLDKGFTSISRVDRKRVVSVIAQIDDTTTNSNEVLAALKRGSLRDLQSDFPGVAVAFGGEQREQADFMASLAKGWSLALLVIFGMLAVPLRSYTQPFIIMSVIPFGLVGAAWGHVLMGYDFSMMSVIGLVALSGVVVNDSLVLVDRVNRYRSDGVPIIIALERAGRARFRAIMLTSLTTFVGLTPLLLETSIQSKLLIPMGISLAFGVVFATAISLLLVPAHYMILEDLKAVLSFRRGGSAPSEASTPADAELEASATLSSAPS